MSQQAVDIAKNIKDLLKNNWTLEDQLAKTEFEWYSYEPTKTEIRQNNMSIIVTFQSGQGDPSCLSVVQMQDMLKIDLYMALRNLEGEKERETAESNRMLVKNEILKIIHDNQTAVTGAKFSKYATSARNDEVDSTNEQWYLHEILFIQAGWYHTET